MAWPRFLAMAAVLLQLSFGIVVLLSAAGVHALMSVTVTRRRREIGVRAALGAQPQRLLMNVFSRAGAQLAFGALVGSALAAALLQGSGLGLIHNAGFVGVVVGVMVLAGLIAATGPALRGLRILRSDPDTDVCAQIVEDTDASVALTIYPRYHWMPGEV